MYCTSQEREELENELYQEDEGDSEGSDANSELEFHLYSQLHYSSNAGEMEEVEDRGEKAEDQSNQQLQVTEMTAKGDGKLEDIEESGPPSPNVSKLQKHLKKKKNGDKHNTQKKGKSDPKCQRVLSSLLEEVIVIDSSPDVISISEDDTADDEGICALKGKGLHRLQTSTPAQQVEERVRSCMCDCFDTCYCLLYWSYKYNIIQTDRFACNLPSTIGMFRLISHILNVGNSLKTSV